MLRSPLMTLPNAGDRPGMAARTGGLGRRHIFKAVITEVNMDKTGLYPTMTFTVKAEAGGMTDGSKDNQISNVTLLQAGFGSLVDVKAPPAGIIFVPEKGSHVLCIHDGSRVCIVGFYTGPIKGTLENAQDAEARLVTYNPGLEVALNRLVAPPGWDIPWLFGLEPGDIVLGHDYTRVKVTAKGLVLASSPLCFEMMKVDGEVLRRFGKMETRGAGYWQRINSSNGDDLRATQHEKNPSEAPPPKDASSYHCTLYEMSPFFQAQRPYVLQQVGHISRVFLEQGRSAIYAEQTPQEIVAEAQKKDFVAIRHCLVQPTDEQPNPSSIQQSAAQSSQKALELSPRGVAYQLYDFQVDADGGFRLRSGNRKEIKGAQTNQPSREMDISVDFDAKKGELLVRLGSSGAEDTIVRLTEKKVIVKTESIEAEASKDIILKAGKITLDCNELEVTGTTHIKKDTKVCGNIRATKRVSALKFQKKLTQC